MTTGRQALIWGALLAAVLLLIYLISEVLTPFVAGFVIAYLLDPAVHRLERWGVSRTLATAVVGGAFFISLLLAAVLLFPLLQTQIVGLIEKLVEAGGALYDQARPWIEDLMRRARLQAGPGGSVPAQEIATRVVQWAGGVLAGLWSGGLALFSIVSLLVISPIVAIYMLRDWNKMIALIDSWLPRAQAPTIRALATRIDGRMSGFLRGQAMVCLLLGIFYAVGLTLAGLNYGFVLGLLTGLFSFVPFVGMTVGMAIGLLMAVFQFDDWHMIAVVLGVFALGQFIEGNFVTPKLVGDRVGLHPVWVMFALLAGGSLFGFLGVLLSVPAAAAIGELTRFALHRYLNSPLYTGTRSTPTRRP